MLEEALLIAAYQNAAARSTQRNSSASKASFTTLGLVGELGSLMSEVKKKQRDFVNFASYEGTVVEEFGDLLWYLSSLCDIFNLELDQVAGRHKLAFSELQLQMALPFSAPSTRFESTLLSLSVHVGELAKAVGDSNKEGVSYTLTQIVLRMVDAANEAGVHLEMAARKNLTKIVDRWPEIRTFAVDFDANYPPYERLPHGFTVDIYERKVKGSTYVVQSSGGIYIGDRITDNIAEGDDYRFHDVFHYAYAAVLGWSPVTRALLKRKRKSETKVDEGQDSARAVIIEEGIATFIFGQAKKYAFFKHEKRGDMSFTLLKQVRQFIEGFEAESCPLWLWEEAILQGCEAFLFLREKRKGRLVIDRGNRVLRVEELSDDPDEFFG